MKGILCKSYFKLINLVLNKLWKSFFWTNKNHSFCRQKSSLDTVYAKQYWLSTSDFRSEFTNEIIFKKYLHFFQRRDFHEAVSLVLDGCCYLMKTKIIRILKISSFVWWAEYSKVEKWIQRFQASITVLVTK